MKRMRPKPRRRALLLDVVDAATLKAAQKSTEEFLRFHSAYYADLARQRAAIQDELVGALRLSAQGPFEARTLQRAVKYKHALAPLSVAGSLKARDGGRFNVGALNAMFFPQFPALYLAVDRPTAEQELLSQDKSDAALTNEDFALTKPDSLSFVSVSVRLERYVDLREPDLLKPFAEAIRQVEVSKESAKQARALGLREPRTVTNTAELVESLLSAHWRFAPRQCGVPANSQVFGQLVEAAKVQGIVYPSKMTGRDCVAVFTRAFAGSDSFIALNDEPPSATVLRRIDSTNWRLAEQG